MVQESFGQQIFIQVFTKTLERVFFFIFRPKYKCCLKRTKIDKKSHVGHLKKQNTFVKVYAFTYLPFHLFFVDSLSSGSLDRPHKLSSVRPDLAIFKDLDQKVSYKRSPNVWFIFGDSLKIDTF